jgi:putative ABC transport system permease protein
MIAPTIGTMTLRLLWARRRTRRVLVAMLALAFVLLFGVVQVLRDLQLGEDLGFDPKGVVAADVSARISSAAGGVAGPDRVGRSPAQVLEEARLQPLVEAATLVHGRFLGTSRGQLVDSVSWVAGPPRSAAVFGTTETFAATLRPTLVAGRWWAADEARDPEPPVVLTAALTSGWGDPAAMVGAIVTVKGARHRVVGVVRDFVASPAAGWHGPAAFVPMVPETSAVLLLRVRGGDAEILKVFEALERRSPGRLTHMRSVEELASFRSKPSPGEALFFAFCLPLLTFVFLSLGGALWLEVGRRTEELGLRRALGATAGAVRRQILTEMGIVALWSSGVGTVGLAHVWALGILLLGNGRGLPTQILPRFAAPLGITTCVLVGLVLAASYLPARRASRLEPVDALRRE